MSKTIRNNLLIVMAQLVVTDAVFIYPALDDPHPWFIGLAPISLLAFGPMLGMQDVIQNGLYSGILGILFIDIVFLSLMMFSVMRNHKIVGCISLFCFNLLSVGFVAAGYP